MCVKLNLNDPSAFKVPLGSWVMGRGLGEWQKGIKNPKNKLHSAQQKTNLDWSSLYLYLLAGVEGIMELISPVPLACLRARWWTESVSESNPHSTQEQNNNRVFQGIGVSHA